jgi:hypothetical protein
MHGKKACRYMARELAKETDNGVWRSWKRAWFGTMRPEVQILSLRPESNKLQGMTDGRSLQFIYCVTFILCPL